MASKGITLPIVYKADDSGLKKAESQLGSFGKAVGKIAGAVAVAFSATAITNFFKESIKAAEGVATANARIEQIAKSTQVFGDATEQVTNRLIGLAEASELRLAVDAEVIKGVQGQLLSFKALAATATTAGGTFDRVTEAAFNMAAAGFGSAESNAIALGKAFEDPIRGLTALRRSGTTFTEEQQNLIKSLVESGNVAGAQTIILNELESQYGGVAEATANASDKFALLFDNIKESVGAELLPIFNELFTQLEPIITQFAEVLGETFREVAPSFAALIPVVSSVMTAFMPMLPLFGQLTALIADVLVAVMPTFVSLFERLTPIIITVVEAFMPLIEQALPILVDLLDMFVLIALPIIEAILPPLLILLEAWAPLVLEIVGALTPLIKELLPLLTMTIEFLVAPALELFATMLTGLPAAFKYLQDSGLIPSSEAIRNWAEGLGNIIFAVRSFVAKAVNSMITSFVGLANGAIKTINAVIDAGSKIPGALGDIYRRLGKLKPLNVADFLIAEPGKFDNLIFPEVDVSGISDVGRRPGQMGQTISAGINTGIFGNAPTAGSYINQAGQRVYFGVTPFAEGGIVTGPTLGMVGEAGPEAIIPLDKMKKMGNTYNITIQSGVGDPVRIGEQVISYIKRYERASGPVFASA